MPEVRTDFRQPACVVEDEFEWVPSPQPGVQRVLLDRSGDEKAVATTVVRYAPGSHFPTHDHPGGEEFVVAEGEFIDEHGRYPAGSYVRNPPGSRHSPSSDSGCILFVKLCQFHPDDRAPVVADMCLPVPSQGSTGRQLHQFQDETVTAVAVAAGGRVDWPAGELVQEVFLLEGRVTWNGRSVGPRTWLRVPAGTALSISADAPSRLLHKTRPDFGIPGERD